MTGVPATVVYDANVLFPAPLRDLLIRIAASGLVRARWTETILDECFRSILARRPTLSPDSLLRTRALMGYAVRDALVTGYEGSIDGLSLPDASDRHVLAAAIQAEASLIVTFNLQDFPSSALEPHGIQAQHPDDFLLDLADRNPTGVRDAIAAQARALRSPPVSLLDLLDILRAQGLPSTAARIRQLCLE